VGLRRTVRRTTDGTRLETLASMAFSKRCAIACFQASFNPRTFLITIMFLRTTALAARRNQAPLIAQALAMLALATGIGLWGALLLAPQPAATPPSLALNPAPGQNISPLINWFGGNSARLRVAVVGLISSGQHGTALLSINGGPAQAYSVGQSLASGVTLAAVLPHGISIDQDGIIQDIEMTRRVLPANWFVPVATPVRPLQP
jgi:general secretion pathway protein C